MLYVLGYNILKYLKTIEISCMYQVPVEYIVSMIFQQAKQDQFRKSVCCDPVTSIYRPRSVAKEHF